MEVIRNYVVDTVKKDNRYKLIKKYGLAQFDSGKYTVPSLKVFINQKPYFTDSLSVEVANVPVDTLQQKMYEIKPIIGAPSASSGIWKWLLIVALLVGVGLTHPKAFEQGSEVPVAREGAGVSVCLAQF